MLLEFRTENYKSFVDEMVFSMTAAPKQKGLDYSLASFRLGRRKYKTLSTAVIYGPNAAGKTNLIGALETFREIVLRGHIRNEEVHSPNVAAYALQFIPNCNGEARPTVFSIKFYDEGLLFEYYIKLDLGTFGSLNARRKVLEERLFVNDKVLFVRDRNVDIDQSSYKTEYFNESMEFLRPILNKVATSSLSESELFLTNGFKSIVSQDIANIVINWFEKKLTVIYRCDNVKSYADSDMGPNSQKIYELFLTDAIKEFGITGNRLLYRSNSDKEKEKKILCSAIGDYVIPAELFESYGTIRFANEFPFIVKALLDGGTLVMDEFDASIHPMALMNIINIFHNDEINVNHAQLIFNTHNPIFLNSSLLRRDEIKFVERDETTGNSIQYALSDFKTAEGVRKGEDYMERYFINRYGAIKDVDFSPILEKLVKLSKETENG